jgi:hypothetical protein
VLRCSMLVLAAVVACAAASQAVCGMQWCTMVVFLKVLSIYTIQLERIVIGIVPVSKIVK